MVNGRDAHLDKVSKCDTQTEVPAIVCTEPSTEDPMAR